MLANTQISNNTDEGVVEVEISPALTVSDVVQAAMAHSPDKIVAQSNEKFSDALSSRASSLFSGTPELSFKHQNDGLISDQGLREWETSLDMPLWMPGQKSASRQKARMSEQETAAYQKLITLQIIGQVRELLWKLKLADAVLTESRQNLVIARALENDVLKRIAAGNLPKQDAILSSKEIMARKMDLINVEAEYIHVAKRYESITGLNQMPEFIEEILEHGDKNQPQELHVEKSPIVELANAKVGFMRAEFSESNNSWSSAPKLSLGLKRERGSFMDRNIDSVSFGLSIPLGADVHMTSKRAAVAKTLAEAERDRELIKREVRLALHEAEHELEICEVQLPFAQSHFELSKENLRLSQKAFDMGESDLLELLKAQEQYFISSSQNNKKIIECKRAIARNNQIRGVLLP